VGHAELKIGDSKIMLADEFPEMDARGPEAYGGSPMSIHLYVENVDTTVQQAVAAGATLLRPVENMFYGDRCGYLADPFGYKWSVASHVEDVSMDEMRRRAAELYGA
jgi:PhnB protein